MIKDQHGFHQKCVFENLRFDTKYPTDIDAFMEVNDKYFIFIEAKRGSKEMDLGQRLALERLCDVVGYARESLLIVCRHDSDEDIDLGNCLVKKYRYKHEWYVELDEITVRQKVQSFIYRGDLQSRLGDLKQPV